MKDACSTALLISLTVGAALAQSGQLATDQIIAAISEGTRSKKLLMATAGSDAANEFKIAVRGPYGRVVSLAAHKTLRYQTITAHEVPRELTGPYLDVIVTPWKPAGGSGAASPSATNVLIRRKGEKIVVEPRKVEPFRVDWDNPTGAKLHSQGLRALFDLSTVPQKGDLEVVVITREFERSYTFKEEERSRMK